jgi:hypothetical protein
MAYWRQCPECGETNYYETGGSQRFDCGFKGCSYQNVRERRCGGKKRAAAFPAHADTVSDDTSRYRLALLDAARVADLLASDLASGTPPEAGAARIRALAEQMRQFAGHGDTTRREFQDFSESKPPSRRALARLISRVKTWS